MEKNDLFNNFEGKIVEKKINNGKSYMDESIESVKTKMKSELDAKIEGQSVINNSLNMLDTTNVSLDSIQNGNVDNTLAGQGNSQNRQRVLVKQMPGGMNMNSSNGQPVVDNGNSNNYYGNINDSGYNNVSGNVGNSMWGFTDTAILLSIAVLIALVFLVSTAAIMYFGLK